VPQLPCWGARAFARRPSFCLASPASPRLDTLSSSRFLHLSHGVGMGCHVATVFAMSVLAFADDVSKLHRAAETAFDWDTLGSVDAALADCRCQQLRVTRHATYAIGLDKGQTHTFWQTPGRTFWRSGTIYEVGPGAVTELALHASGNRWKISILVKVDGAYEMLAYMRSAANSVTVCPEAATGWKTTPITRELGTGLAAWFSVPITVTCLDSPSRCDAVCDLHGAVTRRDHRAWRQWTRLLLHAVRTTAQGAWHALPNVPRAHRDGHPPFSFELK
jgi:hypothetical protein